MCFRGFRLTGVREETVNKDGNLMNSATSAAGGSHLPENQSSTELERFRVEKGLPTYLDNTRCGYHCRLSEDKLSAKYSGTGIHNDDVGAVQANLPVPLERKLPYYFEITVKNSGRTGEIVIGFTGENFPLSMQPGWKPNSYGYHGDDGTLSNGKTSGESDPFGPTFSAGDTVGAGLNYASKEVFFIKKGRLVGKAALLGTTEGPLYPTIGLHSPNGEVAVNFGKLLFDPVQPPSSEEGLPTYLDNRRCGNHCRLSEDKLSAKYFEYSDNLADKVGAVQANLPVYLQRLRYYFEITVVDQGQRGCIAIGFTGEKFPLGRQPGWEPYSYGYHGDNGKLYRGPGIGVPFGPTFSAGDTVGAGLNYETQEIFFTKNGGLVGTTTLVGTTVGLLYPTIGLQSPKEEVVVNFGQRPFAFVQPAVESVPVQV